MAQYLTIARPYACALFENSKTDKDYAAWINVLQVLSYVMDQSAMIHFVSNPKTTLKEKIQVLTELLRLIIAGDLDSLGGKFNNFLLLLIENKRLVAVSDMLTLYQQFVNQAQKITEVSVTSAFKIDQEEQENIKTTLAKRFQTKITAKFGIDKRLIGGAIIRTDKYVIDGSIIGKLASLKQSLNSVKG